MTLDTLKNEALATSCLDWVERQGWTITARGHDRSGPCPLCGGEDRFAIDTRRNLWNCRSCNKGGGDVISLVMHIEGIEFKDALERITGRKAADPVDQDRAERMQREADERRKAKELVADQYRQKMIDKAHKIIADSKPPRPDGPVQKYLAIRGLDRIAASIEAGRFKLQLLELDKYERRQLVKRGAGSSWEVVDACPAMVAKITLPDDSIGAVHMTLLDDTQPNGKRIADDLETGKELPSKLMYGSKKTGAILLFTPTKPKRLVIGEGIETTLSVMQEAFEENTAYWAGVDLGNMAGPTDPEFSGKGKNTMPDLKAPAFVPPSWCKELVLLRDADSNTTKTENQLIRCGRRAMALRPGLTALIADAAQGKDFNDMLKDEAVR